MKKKLLYFGVFCVTLFGNSVFTSKAHDRVVTLYSNNTAFIEEKRDFFISLSGINSIIYEGVANSIISDSVIPEFSDKRLKLYTQTFEKNRADFNSLVDIYKKEGMSVNFFQPTKDRYKRVVKEGYILSKNGTNVTIQEKKSGNVFEIDSKDIFFDTLPKNIKITKPTLTWRVKAYKGKQQVELSYLARGLSWRANYALNIGEKATLKGWITIQNSSGIEYKNSTIFCVAGSINTKTIQRVPRMLYKNTMTADSVKQESFSGYHLYKIPFKEDIQKGSKEILFLDKKGVTYKEYAKMTFSIPAYPVRGVQKYSLNHMIEIKNNKDSSLGIPLPKGLVRGYAKDSSDRLHFIGQSFIPHTPVGESLKLNVGKFFDITAKITQIKYNSSKNRHYINSKIKIELKNQEDKDRKIILLGRYPARGNYKIDSTCKGVCSEKSFSSGETLYSVDLKSKSDYTFYIEYELDD